MGYNFFYRQNAIKPALVGSAEPWIAGGVEFNWPQHHWPATFMPVTTEIEHHPDGSVTLWCSDHDPMLRMKGMHGVCLHRRCSVLELKALWWANVATRVHEQYQSFFPPDVRFVADYAKQAIGSFPLSTGRYYGVDYGKPARSGALLQAIYDYSLELEAAEPKIGSVATSLPVMLLFEEDMGLRNPDRGILPSCAGLVRVWANGHGQTASGDSTPRGSQSRRSCRSASESRRRCFGIVPRVRRYLSGRSGTDLLRCSLNKRTLDRRHGTTAVQKRKSS